MNTKHQQLEPLEGWMNTTTLTARAIGRLDEHKTPTARAIGRLDEHKTPTARAIGRLDEHNNTNS